MFTHHVFFWLKENLSREDIQKFENGVKSLPPIEHITSSDVGQAASTNRPVIDGSYSYSLLLQFKDMESHDAYQVHPVHKKFLDECSHLWDEVLIYDSVSI